MWCLAGPRTPTSARTGVHSANVSDTQELHDLAKVAAGDVLKDTSVDPDVNASEDFHVPARFADAKEDDDNNES